MDLIGLIYDTHLMLLLPLYHNFETLISFRRRAPQVKVLAGFSLEQRLLKLILVHTLSLPGLLTRSLVLFGLPFCFLIFSMLGYQFFKLGHIDGYLVKADVSEVFNHLEALAL